MTSKEVKASTRFVGSTDGIQQGNLKKKNIRCIVIKVHHLFL